ADRNDEQHDDAEHRRRHQQPGGQAIAGHRAAAADRLHRRSFAHLADDVTWAAGARLSTGTGFAAVLASQKNGVGNGSSDVPPSGVGARAGALLGAPAIIGARAQGRTVYVNSYGGVWESSWRKAFFEPFTAQTGIQIKTVPGVSFAKLKAQVQT